MVGRAIDVETGSYLVSGSCVRQLEPPNLWGGGIGRTALSLLVVPERSRSCLSSVVLPSFLSYRNARDTGDCERDLPPVSEVALGG